MNRAAPVELNQAGLVADDFKYSDSRSWRGPCPVCGGHRRFVMFTDHDFPLWHGYCDGCGHKLKVWERVKVEIDPVRRLAYEARARQIERERAEELDRLLTKYSSEEIWQAYARRMGEEQRAWWRGQGVPDDWQTYLRLGYTEDRAYRVGDDLCHSPAYTIPYFGQNFSFKTMQYRLCSPVNPDDRYRFEYGLGAAYYMTSPTEPIGDFVLICEGAKKAIVTRLYMNRMTVLAVPSKSTWKNIGIVDAVKGAGRVYILLDPDASRQAHDLKSAIGKTAKVVSLFAKVDDCFNDYGMTAAQFESYLRQAV